MANPEESIGVGLNKFQDKIDEMKIKGETAQELALLTQSTEELIFKKTKYLIQLGEIVYQKVREEQEADEDILNICKGLVGFDYLIYKNNKQIENLQNPPKAYKCSNPLGCPETYTEEFAKEGKFCSKCGNKIIPIVDNNKYINCINCETKIINDMNFCPCCGIKIKM